MTVAELERRMSAREFMAWVAYASLAPFGPEQEDRRAAMIAHTVAGVAWGFAGGKAKAPRMADYLRALNSVTEAEPAAVQDWTEMRRTLRAGLKEHGANHTR